MIRIDNLLAKVRDRLLLIGEDRQLTEAASLLSDDTRHMVVVCDRSGAMAGIITRTDIVRQIRHCQGCACTTACTAVMTRNVISCEAKDWLHEVWSTMKEKGLQSVPVIDAERKPIGLLFARDALEMLLSEVEYEEELLRDYVMCVGYR
ncbi:CBS domain-containing protein [Mesorhizobium sp. M2C.T.Ca.TU.002.02.1.1]|jgi:CBS-domain-containing membrane protein|uniref:CBS domain-containing protein n=1 Tax=Mesorhizobium sp. M2C.T.Ca.TU.002.02.1.1 TaxID=2496788 RepID=UPI000FCAFEDB|nr:CBS domain-containing protein [Mesorhizobium sp. M2C.T.Ca.TU.002.02.1.1]RUU55771.1 CBS domain-containing protein [Mesorhizobium sp. M2C.T.Ca.TU.002.02.1.1]RUU69774.1 CBS domain-containing protein [Mesorhizobium sp. M2C.T.Ca.TU.009.01.2.1]